MITRWRRMPGLALALALCLPGSLAEAQTESGGEDQRGVPAGAVLSPEARSSHPAVLWTEALAQAEHSGDYTRILADGPPELWDAAAERLLGEEEEIGPLALAVVLRRLDDLGSEMRFRVSAALVASRDPRVLPLLARLAFSPGPEDDPRLTPLAAARFEEPEMRAALDRYQRGEAPFPRQPPEPSPVEPREAETEGWTTLGLLLMLLVSGGLGLVLFLWAFRLLTLRRLVRGLPASRTRSLALGQVALQGEAQPLDGGSLTHPETGELCLFHDRAGGEGARFSVVDQTGRVTVDLNGAVLLSADGTIVPGERIHLIGEAQRSPGERGDLVVRAPERERSAFQKLAQALVGSLMGGLFGRGSARMLFTDPLRCFWVWDDVQATPFSTFRETAWLVGAFVLGGGWVVVFFVAATALLGG